VSLPVSTDFGFHVIRVTGRRVQSFEDVRDDISQRLTELAAARVWSEWLQGAYQDARIELNPRYGVFDPNTGQIVDAPSTSPSG
jgi:parvulin-like peptidyl-prolyl isomerase